jgi:hypothetical protein
MPKYKCLEECHSYDNVICLSQSLACVKNGVRTYARIGYYVPL